MGSPQVERTLPVTARWEGFSPKPYLCPAGFWTIGYGRRCEPDHPPITREQGLAMLREDLEASWRNTARLCHPLTAADVVRGAAVADFTFNLGAGRLRASTLRRKVNARDWDAAAREMRRWVYAGGKKLRGLVLRREVAALWLELGDV